jgi:hypothetical protein
MAEKEPPQISPEDKARIAKAARQLVATANFMRWAANFNKEELVRHPRSQQVFMLSPMQSGRFAFAVDGEALYLGVQPFEVPWLSVMPVETAYVSDRLYLMVDGISVMDSKLLPLGVGFFVDDPVKRKLMASAKHVQIVQMTVHDGRVSGLGQSIGGRIPLSSTDIVRALSAKNTAKMKKQDMSRFL